MNSSVKEISHYFVLFLISSREVSYYFTMSNCDYYKKLFLVCIISDYFVKTENKTSLELAVKKIRNVL